MIDFFNEESNVSDELLAVYIEGNTTLQENALIQNVLWTDDVLSEIVEIVNDTVHVDNNRQILSYASSSLDCSSALNTLLEKNFKDTLANNGNYAVGFDFGTVAVDSVIEDDSMAETTESQSGDSEPWFQTEQSDNYESMKDIDEINNFETFNS